MTREESDFRLGRWIQIKNICIILSSVILTIILFYISNSWWSLISLLMLELVSSIKTSK